MGSGYKCGVGLLVSIYALKHLLLFHAGVPLGCGHGGLLPCAGAELLSRTLGTFHWTNGRGSILSPAPTHGSVLFPCCVCIIPAGPWTPPLSTPLTVFELKNSLKRSRNL